MANSVAKNFSFNLVGNLLSKALAFVLYAYMAHVFGSGTFGQYNVASAEYGYFAMFAALGVNSYGLYLLAKEKDREAQQEIVSNIFSAELISGALATVLLVAYIVCFPGSHKYTLPYAIVLLAQGMFVDWVFVALQDMAFSAFANVFSYAINIALIFLLSYTDTTDVTQLVMSTALSTVLMYVFLCVMMKTRHGLTMRPHKVDFFTYVKKGAPFMASGIFAGINANIDIIIMGFTIGASEIGYYSADYKLINMLISLCGVLFTAVYPKMIEHYGKGDYQYACDTCSILRTALLAFIIPCLILGTKYSGPVLELLFGDEFSRGAAAFNILLIYVLLVYYRELFGYTLTSSGNQSAYMRIVMISASVNFGANMIVIPRFGIIGAAIVTLCSELINLFLMRAYAKSELKFSMSNVRLGRLAIVTAIYIIGVQIIGRLIPSFILAIIVDCVLYLVIAMALGLITKEMLVTLKQVVGR